VNDPGGLDYDDYYCFDAADSTRIQIGGCLGTDGDFDGTPYQNTWPGTLSNPGRDHQLNPTSILFSSPLFSSRGDDHGDLRNYERVAFETDLPRIEAPDSGGICNRTTGANCVNPPVGSSFYPIFTTRNSDEAGCLWQLGGTNIPGTKNTFGGNSAAEYGPLLLLTYPKPAGPVQLYNDFRQVLPNNPCVANSGGGRGGNH